MSSNPSGIVKTVVIEMEPGWLYVRAADPKPAPEVLEEFLKKTINDWFDERPMLVYDRAQPFLIQGVLQGIHVWYHLADRQPASSPSTAENGATQFSIRTHPEISRRHTSEYIEAVVEDAVEILWEGYRGRNDTLVVINRREIAVLLCDRTRKVQVIPAEFIERVVDPQMSVRFRDWLANGRQPFYVMHIAGDWFARNAPRG